MVWGTVHSAYLAADGTKLRRRPRLHRTRFGLPIAHSYPLG
jgi:hypothetical protein